MSTPPTPGPEPEQSNNRHMNRVKLGLGCAGVSMVVCTGLIMVVLIVTPIAFRSLPPEYQDKFMRRLPFLQAFKATEPFAYLPTVAATSANAIALLSSPTPTAGEGTIVATPTGSGLSAGDGDATNSPEPNQPTETPVVNVPFASPTLVAAVPTTAPTLVPTPTDYPLAASYHSNGFEWVPQGWNNCGPANLTQALKFYGWKGQQDDAAGYLKPNREDKNVSPWQMVEYVNDTTGVKALWRVAGDLKLIKKLVSQQFAVIMETGYDVAGEGWMGHYLTVIGYEDGISTLYGLDTWLGDGKEHLGFKEAYDDIDRRWQAFNRAFIVVYPANREGELAALLGPDADLQYNYTHALSVARTEASAQPNNAFAWFNLGSSYTLLHKYKEAATAFDQAQAVGTLPFRMLWYQFTPYEAYYNMGNYSQVLALVQTALATTPYVEETYYWRAMAYAAQGKTAQATDDLKRVLKFNPNFIPATDMLNKLQAGQFLPPAIAQAGQ